MTSPFLNAKKEPQALRAQNSNSTAYPNIRLLQMSNKTFDPYAWVDSLPGWAQLSLVLVLFLLASCLGF